MTLEERPPQDSSGLADFKSEILQSINDVHVVCEILERIQKWAGGQPFITELLCRYFVEFSAQLPAGKEADIIDSIARQKILHDWENNAASAHLKGIHEALLDDAEMRDSVLILYMQILQRGTVPANNSPEQTALLRCGLVTLNNGKLEVTNATYASVFSLKWVEQQLPGITRPISIVSASAKSRQSSLSLRTIALACGVAILAAAGLLYLRGSQENAIATSNAVDADVTALDTDGPVKSSRDLFDQGMEHAENGRWLPMFREFCHLPTTSTYFVPAERQLGRWTKLYEEDLQIARETFLDEGNDSCAVAKAALEPIEEWKR